MFYPSDLLKKGGRFYLCWVADSWPLRFATISQRQLWSQDLRKLCDELLIVMNSETGRPTNRFSLRLSSQLLRGLVRLYQRKANNLLHDLCMINATVLRHTHKKWGSDEEERPRHAVHAPQAHLLPITLEPEVGQREERVEELIQQSNNIVSRIQDITLKEAVIPEILLPPNDNFGEENPDAALQLLADRTLEQMLGQGDVSAAQHSGIDYPMLDVTSKSHDKSRVDRTAQLMERIEEHDVTLFRKSIGADLTLAGDFDKDIPLIPDPILYPEVPVPQPEKDKTVDEHTEAVLPPQEPAAGIEESNIIELQALEEPLAKRRRMKDKLIVDNKIILSSNFLRSRIENPNVELRCEDSIDDVIEIRIPSFIYFRRPARAGNGSQSKIASELTRMFQRNADNRYRVTLADREMEEVLSNRQRRSVQALEKIVEEQEPAVEMQPVDQVMVPVEDFNATTPNISVPRLSKDHDIADMLTQKLESPPQEMRKRTAQYDKSPKRPRLSGYVSFKESQKMCESQKEIVEEIAPLLIETEKENVAPVSDNILVQQSGDVEIEKSITTMLQAEGLADIQVDKSLEIQEKSVSLSRNVERTIQRARSESSETQLGSLDRTKLSLGESEKTTDSKRFIRDNWGTEGTMVKIMRFLKDGKSPVTVEHLISKGPVISGYKKIILARCFTSILKLKQHGFIRVMKNPTTLEIVDMKMGPKLDSCS